MMRYKSLFIVCLFSALASCQASNDFPSPSENPRQCVAKLLPKKNLKDTLPIAILSKRCSFCDAMRQSLANIPHHPIFIENLSRPNALRICGISRVPTIVMPSGRLHVGYIDNKTTQEWMNND